MVRKVRKVKTVKRSATKGTARPKVIGKSTKPVVFKVVSKIPYGPYANSSQVAQVKQGLKQHFGNSMRISASRKSKKGISFTGTLTHKGAYAPGTTADQVKRDVAKHHPDVSFTVTRVSK